MASNILEAFAYCKDKWGDPQDGKSTFLDSSKSKLFVWDYDRCSMQEFDPAMSSCTTIFTLDQGKLPSEDLPKPPVPLELLTVPVMVLSVCASPDIGSSHQIVVDSHIILGKSIEALSIIESIDERHAEIEFSLDCFRIRDLGSSNGSFLDDRELNGKWTSFIKESGTIHLGQECKVNYCQAKRPICRLAEESDRDKTSHFTSQYVNRSEKLRQITRKRTENSQSDHSKKPKVMDPDEDIFGLNMSLDGSFKGAGAGSKSGLGFVRQSYQEKTKGLARDRFHNLNE
jgi:hypothetical protein